MEASKTDNNKINITSKYLQVIFVTNVKDMLECFISLYLLNKSSLQDVFLCPSIQFEDYNPSDDYEKTDRVCNFNSLKHLIIGMNKQKKNNYQKSFTLHYFDN